MHDKENIEVKDLPIFPDVAVKILQLQEDNVDISFKELGSIILLDPALTAKILKVANSALYARQREVTNLQQALALLGFKMVKSLVLLVSASNIYSKSRKLQFEATSATITKISISMIWRHSVLTAFISKYIAIRKKYDDKKEDVFVAGLLHDIGRLVMMINFQDKYEQYISYLNQMQYNDIREIEEKVFDINHQDLGKIVLEKWNFPQELIDSVAQHHVVQVDSKYKLTVQIVGLANIFAKIIAHENLSQSDKDIESSSIKALNIEQDDYDYFTNEFIDVIYADELYTMSASLIG
ncbi:MAG: HDOD domain-containing protein [Spirochaetes bacterium]|nr:HDOD domain-containing protein [Spirochaetota bacterium]